MFLCREADGLLIKDTPKISIAKKNNKAFARLHSLFNKRYMKYGKGVLIEALYNKEGILSSVIVYCQGGIVYNYDVFEFLGYATYDEINPKWKFL